MLTRIFSFVFVYAYFSLPPSNACIKISCDSFRKKLVNSLERFLVTYLERDLTTHNHTQKLKKEKLAYKEAQTAKLKTEKRELAQDRKLRKVEVANLRKEKMAYAEDKKAKLSNEERLARVREIETPKPPRSPLDHVVDMAKKDAKFYLEGKEISSDEAIKALKENKHLNIQTLDSSSKQPKVYISKNPIVIEN